ncbi:beta-glucosidase [Streptomyces sp. SBST2-5]|uniref:Beta-glucosidase n=1 Tax=Streptomyces composti TaxID=2720025 RepID=A0ABX1ADT7_9ACTN|nr:GH1 family beta-glucosidase [Streptomyces composti]NJP51988.1 beta-glucosidase [Streptomyces composti]
MNQSRDIPEPDLPAFPPEFLWGTATAAYQIEGAAREDGRGPSIWDTYCRKPGAVLHGDTGDIACDHYHRMEEDLDLLAGLGVGGYRFSIAWPRVIPQGRGAVNQRGLDFYRRLVDGLLARGIAPMVTLYHWDLPQPLQDQGGWQERDCAMWFADYASVVFDALADRVPYWITLNEPIGASFYAYAGSHAPGLRLGGGAIAAAHHLLLGHGETVAALRALGRAAGRIGITLNFGPTSPATQEPGDIAAAARADALATRWFSDAVLDGAYPKLLTDFYEPICDFTFVRDGDMARISTPLDFLGVNYYKSWVARACELPPPGERRATDLGAVTEPPPGAELTGFGWAVCPDGFRDTLLWLREKYPGLPPLYVTENGCCYEDYVDPTGRVRDAERISFLQRYLRAAAAAIEAGVDLRGYFCWSLLDNFEWTAGYSKRFGLVWVDYPTGERLPKDSYHWYRRVIAAQTLRCER